MNLVEESNKTFSEALIDLRNEKIRQIIERINKDEEFCFYLASFYNFYLKAEELDQITIFMAGIAHTIKIINDLPLAS